MQPYTKEEHEAYRAKVEEAEKKRQEALKEWTEKGTAKSRWIADGGDPGSAEAEFKRTRNERATQSARAKEEAAQREMRERRSRAV
jgi:hypothetical protein